ncbi:MAG: DUF4376 domain-containing protein [Chitinophagaceae bacterium]
MKYLIPIDNKTGKISPLELLDMFIANKGKLELYHTHQNGFDYDVKSGIISKEMIVDYSFDTYRFYVEMPDITKIKPYTDLYYDVKKEVWVYDENIDISKAKKLQELVDYDSSRAVNSFTINGIAMWLPKEERNALYRLATACKNMGQKTMQLQLADGSFVELPPDNVLAMLDDLEVYAGLCFGNTGRKKMEINQITTIEEFEAYDITTGYPPKLNF